MAFLHSFWFYCVIFVSFCLLVILFWLRQWKQNLSHKKRPLKDGSFKYIKYREEDIPKCGQFTWDDCSSHWKKRMVAVGKKLQKNKVDHIYFVHGTFVGDDPFDLLRFLEAKLPNIYEKIGMSVLKSYRKNKDTLIGDLGNFSDEYVKLSERALNHNIKTYRFTWSSGNHHLARLIASIDLIKKLSYDNKGGQTGTLLIGHSHAGQVFALLSQIVKNKKLANGLFLQAIKSGIEDTLSDLLSYRNSIKNLPIDFVTLGSPHRYCWDLSPRQRLLHIINHRGKVEDINPYKGIFTTQGGDYIQLWGIEGSDGISPLKDHVQINKDLQDLLGAGFNLSQWSENVGQGRRVAEQGNTLLVDYGDNGKTLNLLKTGLGHIVYTRYKTMLFNLEKIADQFYS